MVSKQVGLGSIRELAVNLEARLVEQCSSWFQL